jgi:hypothetical protein
MVVDNVHFISKIGAGVGWLFANAVVGAQETSSCHSTWGAVEAGQEDHRDEPGPGDQDQVILLVATNLRAQAEFNPRAFHGEVAAPDASVYRRRKSPVTGLPWPQQRGGRE